MELDPKSDPVRGPLPPRGLSSPRIAPAPLAIVEIRGPAHMVSNANAAFCHLLGKRQEDMIGNPFSELVPKSDDSLLVLNRFYETLDSGTEPNSARVLQAQWPALNANDPPVAVIIQLVNPSSFQRDATAINEALLISGLHQHELTADAVKLNTQLAKEIAERKLAEAALQAAHNQLIDQAEKLEQIVAERTEKLRETVADLEGFSYSIVHDMRAPLRGMQGFARILLDNHAKQLDAVAQGHLERIVRSAVRMDMLIIDVLNYTRVMRGDAVLATVDLDKLVRDIIATYPGWEPPKAVIQIEGTLPSVLGHEGFLTQCVSNLLSNAVKFVAAGVTPQVRVRAETRSPSPSQVPWSSENGKVAEGWTAEGTVVRLWFEDNGIGIARGDRDRIFRMFDRINPAEQFEGTGIGLMIVRKAVQRMGGRIDFESEEGKGSKFWIELKLAPALPETSP